MMNPAKTIFRAVARPDSGTRKEASGAPQALQWAAMRGKGQNLASVSRNNLLWKGGFSAQAAQPISLMAGGLR